MSERHLRILSNDDVVNLVNSRMQSGWISMLHPLELFLARDLLIQELERSLAELRTGRQGRKENERERQAADIAEQQRIDFIAWLHTQPEQVYIALYPADEDGFDIDEPISDAEIEDLFGP